MSYQVAKVALTICLTVFLASSAFAECSRQRVVHTIRYNDCHPKRLLSFACNGTCLSYTKISRTHPFQLERSCQCCQDIRVVQRRTTILCPNNEAGRPFKRVIVPVVFPVACLCRACSQTPEEVLSSGYDVKKNSNDNKFKQENNQALGLDSETPIGTHTASLDSKLNIPNVNQIIEYKETYTPSKSKEHKP